MVRSSAAEQTPMRPTVFDDDGHLRDEERFYEDVLNGRQASDADVDQFVDALAAELEQDIGSMNPVDVRTGQVYKSASTRKTNQAYDPWDDQALDEFMAEFERDGVDPVVDEFGILPPHAGEENAEPPASHARRRLMTAAAAAVLILAAGFAGWAFFGGSSGFGEAVVVRAPDGPYKVKPDPNAKEVVASSEGASVYDTVGGAQPKSEERLVARAGDVPELPAVTPHVSRITLPDGQEVEAELPTGFDPNETGPRRVRTVLVRPDGSLIETQGDKGARTAAATPPPSDGAGQIIARSEAPTADAGDGDGNEEAEGSSGLPPLGSSNQTVASDNAAVAPQSLPPSNLTDASGQPMPINLTAAASTTPDQPVGTTASVPAQASAPLPPAKPAAPAVAPTSGPLDLTAAASKAAPSPTPTQVASLPAATPAAPSAPVASGGGNAGAYVQLSSQRSEEAARSAFAALQRKFPAILGSAVADIQQADLGSKGVYYRARVGAPTKDAAVALCEQLRSAGGDCLIAR